MFRFIVTSGILALIALLPFAFSQNLSQEEILARLEARGASLQDASFLLTGKLIDADGGEFAIEIDVQMIPGENLLRADIYQPDALADNFIMVDGDTLYNYIFLTNQVTLLNANDPDALGGLLGSAAGNGESAFKLNLNLEEIFKGWGLTVTGYEDSPGGKVYLLEFDNLEENVVIHRVEGRVIDEDWIPYSLKFFGKENTLQAELIFSNFKTDQKLKPEFLRYLPDDVEVIDAR